MKKDTQQDLDQETEVYCSMTDTIHSSSEVCDGWHMEWWKAPDWVELDAGDLGKTKYCRRCNYLEACNCFWCGRCNQVTRNSNQGHYWACCIVTGQLEDFHFCCPNDCELKETT
jgi:hypothetical protein